MTATQKIAAGILAGMEVTNDSRWCDWAAGWLENRDRTELSAKMAEAIGYALGNTILASSAVAAANADYPIQAVRVAAHAIDRAAVIVPLDRLAIYERAAGIS